MGPGRAKYLGISYSAACDFMTSDMVNLGAEGEKVHLQRLNFRSFLSSPSPASQTVCLGFFWFCTWTFLTSLIEDSGLIWWLNNPDFFICLISEGPQERCWICLSSQHNQIDSWRSSQHSIESRILLLIAASNEPFSESGISWTIIVSLNYSSV